MLFKINNQRIPYTIKVLLFCFSVLLRHCQIMTAELKKRRLEHFRLRLYKTEDLDC